MSIEIFIYLFELFIKFQCVGKLAFNIILIKVHIINFLKNYYNKIIM